MAANTSTSYSALLKEVWPQEDIYDLLFENMPFLGIVPKDTEFYEKVRHIALGYGAGQGVGADFAVAKSAKTASKEAEFQVTTWTHYSLFSITRKVIRQSKNKRGAILASLARESELALKAWKRELAVMLPGNGGGSIGVGDGSWTVSGSSITLSDINTVVNFEIGMQLQFATTDGTSGSVKAGYVTVSAVNPDTGVITISESNASLAVPGVANTDYIFRNGNFGAMVKGIGAFIDSSSTPGALYNMTRTDQPVRKAGIRVSATNLLPREAAMKAAKEVFIQGGKPSHYFEAPNDFLALQLDLQSAGSLLNTKEPAAKIGSYTFGMPYEGIGFMGPSGIVKVLPDYTFTPGTAFMLMNSTWKLASTGELCYMDDEDGNRILREENADAYEGRVVGDYALYCEAPGYNARVTF